MSNNSEEHNAKRMARLAAVQGLYQIALTQCLPKEVIAHFSENPSAFIADMGEANVEYKVDKDLFINVVSGVIENQATVDEMVAGALDARLSADRVETLLRAIMRAGAYELHHNGGVASGVIINDYVDVAHTFFDAKEPGFVNAVLDKLAKNLRPI